MCGKIGYPDVRTGKDLTTLTLPWSFILVRVASFTAAATAKGETPKNIKRHPAKRSAFIVSPFCFFSLGRGSSSQIARIGFAMREGQKSLNTGTVVPT